MGKTGDAIIAYLDEVLIPVLVKTGALQEELSDVMEIMITDMIENFGSEGVVDLAYVSDKYVHNFQLYANKLEKNGSDVNRITRLISDIIELPQLNDEETFDLSQQLKREVYKIDYQMSECD